MILSSKKQVSLTHSLSLPEFFDFLILVLLPSIGFFFISHLFVGLFVMFEFLECGRKCLKRFIDLELKRNNASLTSFSFNGYVCMYMYNIIDTISHHILDSFLFRLSPYLHTVFFFFFFLKSQIKCSTMRVSVVAMNWCEHFFRLMAINCNYL